MSWKETLDTMLSALGDEPNDKQCDNLEYWVMNNVPIAYLGEIVFDLPSGVSTRISMRMGELGL